MTHNTDNTDITAMAQEIEAERKRNGYTEKLYKTGNYKAVSDEHKGEVLRSDIMIRAEGLNALKAKVNWSDLDDVKQRTYNYFKACAEAECYPSVMGLAVHGFGISRQALNQYLLHHRGEAAAEFVNMAKDTMADILVNASLYNNANPVQVLFQLKNHFGHADKSDPDPIPPEDPHIGTSDEECREIVAEAFPYADMALMSPLEIRSKALAVKYHIDIDEGEDKENTQDFDD